MRDTDKRVGGWENQGGGWKKKKQAPKAPVEVPVEPSKPAPKRKEPEPTVVPPTKSKVKPRTALAIKDEAPAETFARKYKEKTRATQGKFEKRRKDRVREERIEERLDAIPPMIQEYPQQEGRAVKYIKRSADAAKAVSASVKNLAKRSMQALMGQATSGVSSVTQGIASTAQARLMGAMLQRLRTSRQRAVRGYKKKSPGPRDRRDRR